MLMRKLMTAFFTLRVTGLRGTSIRLYLQHAAIFRVRHVLLLCRIVISQRPQHV